MVSLITFSVVLGIASSHAFLLPHLSMVRNVKPTAVTIRHATTEEDARAVIETYKSGISESRGGKPNRAQAEKVTNL
jgi:hypothetical protein